jgi:hypothetical protein
MCAEKKEKEKEDFYTFQAQRVKFSLKKERKKEKISQWPKFGNFHFLLCCGIPKSFFFLFSPPI